MGSGEAPVVMGAMGAVCVWVCVERGCIEARREAQSMLGWLLAG